MSDTITRPVTDAQASLVKPTPVAHIIKSDNEALEIAYQLAQSFKQARIKRDRERLLPFAEIESLSQSGLWAITVPKRFGGADVSSWTVAQIIALLSGADGAIGQIPQNHYYALEVLKNTGAEAQQQRIFAEVLQGARLGNALAEFKPKNAVDKTTKLTSTPGGYLINGEKFYCTGSLFAHRIPTLVKDDNDREFLAFVQRDAKGLTLIDDWQSFGQRTTGSGTVLFDQVFVDRDDVIALDTAYQNPTVCGPFAQLLHAAIETGIARGAFEETLVQVRQARPWIDSGVDKATDDPLTLLQIGRSAADVRAVEVLLKHAAQTIDAARPTPNEQNIAQASLAVAAVRALSTEVALKTSSQLIELAGSRGSQRDKGLDLYWRNARVHTLHDAARWKYYFIANYALNGVLPPRRGTL